MAQTVRRAEEVGGRSNRMLEHGGHLQMSSPRRKCGALIDKQ